MGTVLLTCPASNYSPFLPTCELHMEFRFQLGVLVVLSTFHWGSYFSLLPMAVANAMEKIIIIIIFIANSNTNVI